MNICKGYNNHLKQICNIKKCNLGHRFFLIVILVVILIKNQPCKWYKQKRAYLDTKGKHGYVSLVMIQSTISNTKNHLSELIQKVRSGETVMILDRDTPVAKVLGVNSLQQSLHVEPAAYDLDVDAFLNMPLIHANKDLGILSQALSDERNSGW